MLDTVVYTNWFKSFLDTGEWPRDMTRKEYKGWCWFFRFRRRELQEQLRKLPTKH